VAGPTPPPKPPKSGVADPLSKEMKAGRWQPAVEAQKKMVDTFKKKHSMK